MTVLIVVRHAATAWSESGRVCGRTDVPLSSRGRWQAGNLRDALAAEMRSVRPMVFSSPAARALDTARIALPDSEAADNHYLAERDFGSLEGLTRQEAASIPGGHDLWTAPGLGAESMERVHQRAVAFWNGVVGNELVIAFTHGVIARVLAAVSCRQPITIARALELSTGSFGVIAPKGEARVLIRWNPKIT